MECVLTEKADGTFEMHEIHIRKGGGKIIKEAKKTLTVKEAKQYKIKHKKWLVETYTINK